MLKYAILTKYLISSALVLPAPCASREHFLYLLDKGRTVLKYSPNRDGFGEYF